MNAKDEQLPIPHPGETLLEDFIKPLGLTPVRVAKDLGVHGLTVSLLIRGRRAVTPELALRLSRYTGTTPDFWLGLQEDYELRHAERKHARRIEQEVQLCPLIVEAA